LTEEVFLMRDFSIFKSIFISLLFIAVLLLSIYIFYQIKKQGTLSLIKIKDSNLSRLRFFIITE